MKAKDKEKERKLSPAEQKRLARFEERAAQLTAQGYRRKELTVGIVQANVFAFALAVPVFLGGLLLFYRHNGAARLGFHMPLDLILLLVIAAALIAAHEGIHGLTWSLFAPQRWRDIEFGFMKEYLTPYCACMAPLRKGPYILGALMPLIALGLIPTLAAILAGSYLWLMIGFIMIISAGGDILIVWKLLTYKSTAKEIIYCDHPTQAGGVVFER